MCAGRYAIQTVSESRRAAQLDECTCVDRLAPYRFPTSVPSARENPVVGSDVMTSFFPFHECLQNSWMNRHGLLRGFCLARPYHSTHDRARDAHCPLIKIDVSPF